MASELLKEMNMKTILLVDNDRFNHAMAICAFAPHSEFHLMMATNYLEALWVLCEQEVDLVIVQMEIPNREGLELLTYLANYRPKIPVLTLSSKKQTVDGAERSGRCHLSTPLQPHGMLTQVRQYLKNLEQGKHRPLGLLDLLVILRHEKATCILKVTAGADTGQILFSSGKIIHADCGRMEGEAAVRYMLAGDTSWFRVEPVPTRLTKRHQDQASVAKSFT